MTITGRATQVMVGICVLALVAVGVGSAVWNLMWLGVFLVFVGLCVVDGAIAWRRPKPELERVMQRSLPLGVASTVRLCLTSSYAAKVELYDGVAAELGPPEASIQGQVKPGVQMNGEYEVRPIERGRYEVEAAFARIWGPLGLVARQCRLGSAESVRVVPNFQALSRVALMATEDQVGRQGVRQVRRRGHGMEFDCLREYREGDQLRQIDWKATARHRRLIARQYEDEKNQQILVVFDCGRRMRARDGALSHFDHALNAGLLLSYVALNQGDTVGVATFGGDERWIPGQRGPRAVRSIVDQLFDVQATMAPSDYTETARRLSHLQKRRSLIVVLTNLYDAESDELKQMLGLLGRRHLVLVASLQEEAIDELRNQEVGDFDGALTVSATHHFVEQRREVHERLEQNGAMVLDTTASNLSVGLVNRYLEIKRAGRL